VGVFSEQCSRLKMYRLRTSATHHNSTTHVFDGWNDSMLADQLVGGRNVGGPPDLHTHWTQVETVDDERKQYTGLVERDLREK